MRMGKSLASGSYTNEMLELQRQTGDLEADRFIAQVFSDPVQKNELQHILSGKTGTELISELQCRYGEFDFIRNATILPSWADPKLINAGTDFFARHAESIMSLLGLLSLPYCYAGANGSMVLYLSELIRKQTTKRLHDTALFVWGVLAPGAFDKNGKAYEEIIKVRIMHAAVRYYTLQSGKWNNTWGLPVNQEDMAGTNLSFSLIVIRGLRLLGFSVSQDEQAAFLHIWAVIGYLSGLNEELIPEDSRKAQQLDKLIKKRQFRSSVHGRELALSLTEHILKVNKSKATAKDILGLMRHLLGTEIADMIDIKNHTIPAYKLKTLRAINFLKGFRPQRDTRRLYHEAYAAFKAQAVNVNN